MTTTLKMKVVTSVINGGFRIENFDNDIFLFFTSILFSHSECKVGLLG